MYCLSNSLTVCQSVLYLALIAFWGEYCQIVIQLEIVYCTKNLAKGIVAVDLSTQGFYPAPRSRIF